MIKNDTNNRKNDNKKHSLSYQEQCPSIWLGRKQLGFHYFHIRPEYCYHDDEAGDVDVGDDSDVDDVGDYGQLNSVKV